MAKFIGEYNSKIDQKGRVVFPAAFKSVAQKILAAQENGQQEPLQFIIKKDLFSPCLEVYTYQEWEKQSEQLRSQLNLISFNREKEAFWRAYMSDRAIVEPDEKSGRILIPRQLLEKIGASTEVTFIGGDFKIEIWDKQTYEKSKMNEEDYVALAEKLLS